MRNVSKLTWQFLEQEGRLGWDHREVSKLRAEPEDHDVQNFKAKLIRFHGRQCKLIYTRYVKTYLTLDTVSAGDHWDLSMSRQIAPLLKEIITKYENVVFLGFTC